MRDLEFLIGQTLDSKYRLEQKLGQGGMGAVFRATHLGTDRVVALKLIVPGLMDQQDFVARFQREARATGRLRHPNIVDMTDFGFTEANGEKLAYLVMEFLEGESLKDLLKNNPTPPLPFVVDVIQQVCSALQEAHDKGIVHRDLKPDNLWLEPNRRGGLTVKILDFGLAKIYDPKARAEGKPGLPVEDTETRSLKDIVLMTEALPPGFRPSQASAGADPLMTEVGSLLGTPAYMSPEQCRGVAMDHRSDLYSLGVIAYQMLSGHTPFQGGSMDLVNQHIQSAVPPLASLRKDLPEGLCALVMASMEKDPALRPQTAETFGEAFAAYCETPFTAMRVVIDVINQHGGAVYGISLLGHSMAILFGALYLVAGLIATLVYHRGLPTPLLAILLVAWVIGLFLGMTLNASSLPPVLFHGLTLPLKPIKVKALLKKFKRRIVAHLLFNLRLLAWMGVCFTHSAVIIHGANLRDAVKHQGLHPTALQALMISLARPMAALVAFGLVILVGVIVFRKLPYLVYVPPILNVEDCSWEQAVVRSCQLNKNPLGRYRQVVSNTGKVAVAAVFMVVVILGGTLGVILVRSIAEGNGFPMSRWTLFLVVIAVTILSVLTTPIAEMMMGYKYLHLRRMCRESLRQAFQDLKVRLETDGV